MTKTGYIYKIAIKDGSLDDCYIGSTSRIRQRRSHHKCCCNNPNNKYYNLYVYCFIRDNGGFDNWNLYELEKVEYNEKIELHKKEREWIERIKPALNKNIPTRTMKEYRQVNKDKLKEQNKEYYEANKDKIKEQNKKYYEENKDIIKDQCKEYRQKNKDKIIEKDKKLYQDNKDERKVCNRKYYEANKEKRKEKMKEYKEANKEKLNKLIICQCGSTHRKDTTARHKKSIKHIKWTESNQ